MFVKPLLNTVYHFSTELIVTRQIPNNTFIAIGPSFFPIKKKTNHHTKLLWIQLQEWQSLHQKTIPSSVFPESYPTSRVLGHLEMNKRAFAQNLSHIFPKIWNDNESASTTMDKYEENIKLCLLFKKSNNKLEVIVWTIYWNFSRNVIKKYKEGHFQVREILHPLKSPWKSFLTLDNLKDWICLSEKQKNFGHR